MSQTKAVVTRSSRDITKMIIQAIDSLKNRKARPDESKICGFLERRFQLNKSVVIKALNDCVNEGSILKVKYKNSVSYRNPANFSKMMFGHVVNQPQEQSSGSGIPESTVIKRISRAVRELTRPAAVAKSGTTTASILRVLHDNYQMGDYNEAQLSKVLKKAVEIGKYSAPHLLRNRLAHLCLPPPIQFN